MSDAAAMFLSIKPKYADKILNGDKTVELRRTRPKAQVGSPILLYASSPRRSLMGIVYITKIMVATPVKLWNKVKTLAGVTKAEFDAYFEGTEKAVAIFIERVSSLPMPVELEALRVAIPSFRPPQSFIYVRMNDPQTAPLLKHLRQTL